MVPARPREVLESRIELWNCNTGEMLRHYVGNRKKGHIFINMRTGKGLTLRHFEKMIDKWARLLNIQKQQSIKPSGREYHLITLMGLKGDWRKAP